MIAQGNDRDADHDAALQILTSSRRVAEMLTAARSSTPAPPCFERLL
jgi:hypothetical protein